MISIGQPMLPCLFMLMPQLMPVCCLKAAAGGTNQYTPLCIVSLDCIWTSSVYNTLLAWFVDGGVEDNFGVGSIRFIPQYFDKDKANSPLYVRPFLAF